MRLRQKLLNQQRKDSNCENSTENVQIEDYRLLSLKAPNIEFDFDVSFSTLLQPCKQYIEILHQITNLHAIIRPYLNF